MIGQPGVVVGADPDLHFQTVAFVERRISTTYNGLARWRYTIDLGALRVARKKGRKPHETALEMIRKINSRFPCPLENCAGLQHGLVVEGQQSYLGKNQKARPEDLIALAMVGGALIDRFIRFGVEARYPLPREWKKGVPKEIHQARICKKLGWAYERKNGYVVPTDFRDVEVRWLDEPIVGSQWKHAMDSIGLALWGLEH